MSDQPPTDVSIINRAPDLLAETPQPSQWLRDYAALARAAAADLVTVPRAIRGKPASILATAIIGRELGLEFMESLRLIDLLDGRPAIRAELKTRWILAAGHKLEVVYQDHNRLRLRGVRKGTGEAAEVEWAISRRDDTSPPSPDATIAEEVMFGQWEGPEGHRQKVDKPMTTKDNWANYPGDMMWARCVSQLHRRLFADVRGAGIYATEELDADAPGTD